MAAVSPSAPRDLPLPRFQWPDKKLEALARGIDAQSMDGIDKESADDPFTKMTWRKRSKELARLAQEAAAAVERAGDAEATAVAAAARSGLDALAAVASDLRLEDAGDALRRLVATLVGAHAADAALLAHGGNARAAGASLAETAAEAMVAAWLRSGCSVASSDGACILARVARRHLINAAGGDVSAAAGFDAGLLGRAAVVVDPADERLGRVEGQPLRVEP